MESNCVKEQTTLFSAENGLTISHTDSFAIIRENYKAHQNHHVHQKLDEKTEEEKDEAQIDEKSGGGTYHGTERPQKLIKHFSFPEQRQWFENEETEEEHSQERNFEEGYESVGIDYENERENGFDSIVKPDSLQDKQVNLSHGQLTSDTYFESFPINETKDTGSSFNGLGSTERIDYEEEDKDLSVEVRTGKKSLESNRTSAKKTGKHKEGLNLSTVIRYGASYAYGSFRSFFRASELTTKEALDIRAQNIKLRTNQLVADLDDEKLEHLRRKYSQKTAREHVLKSSELTFYDDSTTLRLNQEKMTNGWEIEYRCDSDSETSTNQTSTEVDLDFNMDASHHNLIFFTGNRDKSILDLEEDLEDANEPFYYSSNYTFPHLEVNLSNTEKCILKKGKEGQYGQELLERLSMFLEQHFKHLQNQLNQSITNIEDKDENGGQKHYQLLKGNGTEQPQVEENNSLKIQQSQGDVSHLKLASKGMSTNSFDSLTLTSISSPSACLCCSFEKSKINIIFHDGENLLNIGNGLGEENSVKYLNKIDQSKVTFRAEKNDDNDEKTHLKLSFSCNNLESANITGPLKMLPALTLCFARDVGLQYPLCNICQKRQTYCSNSPSRKNMYLHQRKSALNRSISETSLSNKSSIDSYTSRSLDSRIFGRFAGEDIREHKESTEVDNNYQVKTRRHVLFADELPIDKRAGLDQEYVSSFTQYSFSSRGIPEPNEACCVMA